jgi:hypothetical protein
VSSIPGWLAVLGAARVAFRAPRPAREGLVYSIFYTWMIFRLYRKGGKEALDAVVPAIQAVMSPPGNIPEPVPIHRQSELHRRR